jgi:glutaminyl-peptide cyclotransferase
MEKMELPGVSLNKIAFFLFLCTFFCACSTNPPPAVPVKEAPATSPKTLVTAPDFNADTAFAILKKQVDFGPRVPNTPAHEKCARYLIEELKANGMQVGVQEGKVVTYEGKTYSIKNIMASFHPEVKSRIILFTHWDARHIADRDSVRKNEPIDAADDGASGPGVLIEIARQMQKANPAIGVDMLLLDAEDTGLPSDDTMHEHKEDTWCLGTQYWTQHMPKDYTPRYGILLDMVGAKKAVFAMDGLSMEVAPDVVRHVWSIANDLGYSSYFVSRTGGQLIDDHSYINKDAKIPTIDIVYWDPDTEDFGPHHHRHSDNLSVIDKNTLKAVGQTLLQVIYTEAP